MTIDNRTNANNRPYVPGANATTHTYAGLTGSDPATKWQEQAADGAKKAANPKLKNYYTEQQFADLQKKADAGDEGAKKKLDAAVNEASALREGTTNNAVNTLLETSEYLDNSLNKLYQPTYHFRLFMTTEHELITDAKTGDQKSMMAALDKLPQITIAESGVTAGFNIKEVEIEQNIGPGWRTRSAMMSGVNITIVEPLGTSLVENMINSGATLGVQNYAKFWYFLELSFLGYDENGAPNMAPLADMNLDNGGRWVYQIQIVNMHMQTDESGATYNLTCLPYSASAFEDDGVGRTPDNIKVGGKTVKDFCDNLAKALESAWEQRYAGKIYTFKIINRPITGKDGEEIDISKFALNQSSKDSQRGVSFGEPSSSGGKGQMSPEAQIPRGSSLADVLTFLYAHCEGAQKIMLDTTSSENLDDGEDDTVNWNGKNYRVAMVPMIEPDVRVTGYDPITGNYMKEITYNIWGYRNYTTNMSPNQYRMVADNPEIGADIIKDLLDKKYLQKKYEYLFTGMNTEVIKFNLDFNYAFCAVLPSLSGWRANIDSVSDHEVYNPAVRNTGGSQTEQKNETKISPEKIQQKMVEYNTQIDSLDTELQNESDEKKQSDIQARINNLRVKRDALKKDAKLIREATAAQSKLVRDRIERDGVPNPYAEDATTDALPFTVTYKQGNNEAADAAGAGFFDQWHRGSSLTGALLNQAYAPVTDAMISITLDIRGDPYWIGHSNIERRAITQNPKLNPRPDNRPNFAEGDSTFALMFRFPKGIADDGSLIIRKDDVFNGVYRATSVKHNFREGQFTQTLEAFKLELITVTRPKGSGSE